MDEIMSDPESKVVVVQSVNDKGNSANKAEESVLKPGEKTTDSATMNTTTSEDSEYETLEEDNGGSSKSSRSRRSSFSDDHDDLSDDIAIEDEREDGDGQEENSLAKDKKLDDDEDRRNPQYIPKKGTFYEHDDRTMMDENGGEIVGDEQSSRREKSEEGEKEVKTVGMKKGKVWTEKADKWSHDLYVEDEQKPKSTQELIDTYGYDIRNEESPPKARRRRRYGRGPNKYTRNWEDEDAYTRSMSQKKVYQNNKEEFPDLGETVSGSGGGGRRKWDKPSPGKSKSPSRPHSQSHPAQANGDNERERERGPRRDREKNEKREREERPIVEREKTAKPAITRELPPATFSQPQDRPLPATNNFTPPPMVPGLHREKEGEQRVGRGRGFRGTGKPRPTVEFTASRSRASIPPAFNRETVTPREAIADDSLKHAADMLAQDFSHIYINNNNNSNNIVEETIIPRSERRTHTQQSESSSRSKRYSTQRQRSLPETTPPPTYSPPHNIPYYTQPPPSTGYVPAPVYNEVAPPPVTSPPMQMVAFLPPGPPPAAPAAPPYPPPPLINYMPPPAFPPMALQPPPISGQFEDLSQGAELYHGGLQGGITYYSTQSQSAVPRPNPPRRVKLAIPIVPPPDKSGANKRGNKPELQSAAS